MLAVRILASVAKLADYKLNSPRIYIPVCMCVALA